METTTILSIVLAVIASGGFWTFLQYIINKKDKKQQMIEELTEMVKQLQKDVEHNNRQMSLQNEAIMAQAQERIIYLCTYHQTRGFCPIGDFQTLDRLSRAYQALGGNGIVKIEMDKLAKLPHQKEEKRDEKRSQ